MNAVEVLKICRNNVTAHGFPWFCGWAFFRMYNALLKNSVKANQLCKKRILNASEQDLEKRLKAFYFYKTGEKLDLNHPQTFNEKMQWLKLRDSSAIKTRLADKSQVGEWIAQKIGPGLTPPLLGVWESFDDISPENLPERFMLKASHGSGWNYLVSGGGRGHQKGAEKAGTRIVHVLRPCGFGTALPPYASQNHCGTVY